MSACLVFTIRYPPSAIIGWDGRRRDKRVTRKNLRNRIPIPIHHLPSPLTLTRNSPQPTRLKRSARLALSSVPRVGVVRRVAVVGGEIDEDGHGGVGTAGDGPRSRPLELWRGWRWKRRVRRLHGGRVEDGMVMGPLGIPAAVWVRWDEVVAGCYTEGWRRRGMDQSISGRVPDTGSWHGGVFFGGREEQLDYVN